jgi:hypothetical protein
MVLELAAIGALALVVCILLTLQRHRSGRRPPTDVADRIQVLSDSLVTLQRTLDARLDYATEGLNTSLVTA